MSTTTPTIVVRVKDRAFPDRQLDMATALLRKKATCCGILVTRVNFTTFTVTASPDTKFGITREIDLAVRENGRS